MCLTDAMAELELRDNAAESRFEAWVDGERAGVLVYEVVPRRIIFVHTAVDAGFAGQGVAPVMVRKAFEEIRARGGPRIVPVCPYVRSWLKRNPQYLDMVQGPRREQDETTSRAEPPREELGP